MYFEALFVSFLFTITIRASTTYKDRYLPGRVERTIFNADWLGCLQACHDEPKCISYNYCKENKSCEINYNGTTDQCEVKPTVFSRGWIFHQIRPVPEQHIVPELGDDPSRAAKSCEEIFTKRSNVFSRPYYIETLDKKTSFIYCKMESTDECGTGGWTLAMKIDGNKTTFRYDSPLWTNKESYNEAAGVNLSNKETKFAVFGSIFLKEGFCVAMRVKGETRWLKINRKATSAMGIFTSLSFQSLSVGRPKWKSLINGSFMPSACSDKQGFNVQENNQIGGRARIGMIGHENGKCSEAAVSRIGFGTDGSAGGMDTNNSCGNEFFDAGAGLSVSIKAFCYIFIK